MAIEPRRYVNPMQPQTLQIAVFLLYFDAFFNALYGLTEGALLLLLAAAAGAFGAYGIANERKWGYGLSLVAAFSPFLLNLAYGFPLLSGGTLNLLFEIALIALLLHPMSRDYQRIWFK
jgi:hypothetical protein